MRLLAAAFAALLALAPASDAAARAPWIKNAVVYGVVPALAGPRGLADVTAHLGAIARLGATVVWLTPLTNAPKGDFGYAATDLFHIRPTLGSAADLHRLVAVAHAHGLKVILDLPLNDLSDQHPFYRDAERRGKASPYYDFFDRDKAGNVTHYFSWRNLENLNYANPRVRRYAAAVGAYWLEHFAVDGFRLDAAWGPRQRAPDFWPNWIAQMRRIKPDILLLAEGSERDPYYAAAGFDAAYDWTDRLGERPWQGAFADGAIARRLRAGLAAENDTAPIFRCLDDNDSGRRFISRHGVGLTRVTAAMLMTLPGIPCLFMGDDDGAEFSPYRAKAPIDWRDPHHLRRYFHRVIALRHREAALRSSRLVPIRDNAEDDVLAYLRPAQRAGQSLLVLLNFGREAHKVRLPAAGAAAAVLDSGAAVDLLSGERLTFRPEAPAIELAPLSARLLRRAPGP